MLHKRVQEVMIGLLKQSLFDGELSPRQAIIVFEDGRSTVAPSVTPVLNTNLVYCVGVPKIPHTSGLGMKVDRIIFHDKHGNKTVTFKNDGTMPLVRTDDVVNVTINTYYDLEG